jgi:ribosomal subunit interface protein
MQTTITARHGEVEADLKTRTEQVISRLAQRIARPVSAHVTFDIEPRPAAELVFTAANNIVHVARAEADDLRTAFDRMAAKFARQLDKAAPNPKKRAVRPRKAASS